MPLSENLRARVEERMARFCRERVPEHARHQVRLSYKLWGNHVTLIEERIAFLEPGVWVDIPVAQFRFDPDDSLWRLYWSDRNNRWHAYWDVDPARDLEPLLAEVDEDPTGIFWG